MRGIEMSRRPDLIIDSNERGSLCESIERKATKMGMHVVRKTLVVGDYLLGGALVEAKSVDDLFQSSHSGHLWRQLDNMDANYERFFIVIHGSIDKYVALAKRNGRNVTYTRIQNELTGTIARIMCDFDCQVFFTPNTSEAAQFIVKLHDKLHKPASRHGAQSLRRVASNDLRHDLLLTIPGIGNDVAERLLEKCGSIEEMCHKDSLKQIKGLGEVLRKRIIDVLTSEEEVKIERKTRRNL
jgi:ERCC4-type nuclease|tara:strand:- start:866 stop:1588 length:723 start_codon:yes stop_codon:yes gene_type:complete